MLCGQESRLALQSYFWQTVIHLGYTWSSIWCHKAQAMLGIKRNYYPIQHHIPHLLMYRNPQLPNLVSVNPSYRFHLTSDYEL